MRRLINTLCLLFLISSCSMDNKNNYLNEIRIEDTFSQNEKKYYVLFYLESCPSCRDTLKFFNCNYFKDTIYKVNMIYSRNYLSSTFSENKGIFNYLDIRIHQVPTMFLIAEGHVSLVFVGYENIRTNSWTS